MQKIETTVDVAHMRTVEDRLRSLGIRRITALQVEALGEQDVADQPRLIYRGLSASFPAKRVQLQVLVEDVDADAVVDSLRALAMVGHARLDSVLVYPVGTLTAIAALNPSCSEEFQSNSALRPARVLT